MLLLKLPPVMYLLNYLKVEGRILFIIFFNVIRLKDKQIRNKQQHFLQSVNIDALCWFENISVLGNSSECIALVPWCCNRNAFENFSILFLLRFYCFMKVDCIWKKCWDEILVIEKIWILITSSLLTFASPKKTLLRNERKSKSNLTQMTHLTNCNNR